MVHAYSYRKLVTMKSINLFLGLFLAFATAAPRSSRIIGGSVTTIDKYPEFLNLITSPDSVFWYPYCAGTLINSRTVLSAAHCTQELDDFWAVRVGTHWSTGGGFVYRVVEVINHPEYELNAYVDKDISILKTMRLVVYVPNQVQPAVLATSDYYPEDNSVVTACGYGQTEFDCQPIQLRHVDMWVVNSEECGLRYYDPTGWVTITENMICAGWLDVGGRDQCQGDSGGPLYHNGVVVGVTSFGARVAPPGILE